MRQYDSAPARFPWLVLVLLGVNAAVIAFLVVHFWTTWEQMHAAVPTDKNFQPRSVESRGPLTPDETTNVEIFEQNSPCTVNVTTFTTERDPDSFNVLKIPRGTGTGIIWDTWKLAGGEFGIIVTNYHVISPARQNGKIDPNLIQITLADHTSWKVRDVNFAEDKDVAVLWTNAPVSRLKLIKIGESSNLKVGQKVYAIGNPFGLDQSLTTGIISALGRQIRSDETKTPMVGLIQTDASINPGNSGGPLLDSAGRLIGVNTAIVSPSGASAGIGFAIPVDDVNRVVTALIKKEPPEPRPSLGVHIAANLNLRGKGVLILGVEPDGPAASAGLRPTNMDGQGIKQVGDIITAINDMKIRSTKDLNDALAKCKVGQEVTIGFLRDDQEMTAKLTLAARYPAR
jgi:S1-C subfamily serine protease